MKKHFFENWLNWSFLKPQSKAEWGMVGLILTGVFVLSCGVPAVGSKWEKLDPRSGGMIVSPRDGMMRKGQQIRLSFPKPMVSSDQLKCETVKSVIRFTPPLKHEFQWMSQTEGRVTVKGAPRPDTTYSMTFVEGLQTETGEDFSPEQWGSKYYVQPFVVNNCYVLDADIYDKESTVLPVRPHVQLDFSHPVRPHEVVKSTYFQESGGWSRGKRYPLEVKLKGYQKEGPQRDFIVSPIRKLPVGKKFSLVIDGIKEAGSGAGLQHLKAFRLGQTTALEVDSVSSLNYPMKSPVIVIRFNDRMKHSLPDRSRISLSPKVSDLKVIPSGNEVRLEGSFDIKTPYQVSIGSRFKGQREFPMEKPFQKEVKFSPKRASVIFPQELIVQRRALGIHFSFMTVNLKEANVRLAKIPLSKLPQVRERLREFQYFRLNEESKPIDNYGKELGNVDRLFVDDYELETVSSFKLSGEGKDDLEEFHEIHAGADGSLLPGVYLVEASGETLDGRLAGNRSLVVLSDYVVTRKRMSKEQVVRVVEMGDGSVVPNSPVKVLTSAGKLVTEGRTGSNGQWKTTNVKGASMLVIGDESSPAIHFLNLPSFRSGNTYSWGYGKDRGVIFTDRGLYRPGETVKFKGIFRDVQSKELTLPKTKTVNWKISRYNKEITNGKSAVSSAGGWEAEWNIPENLKPGYYNLRAGRHQVSFSVQEFRRPLFSVEATPVHQVGDTAIIKIQSNYFHGSPNSNALVRWNANWNLGIWMPGADYPDGYVLTNEYGAAARSAWFGTVPVSGLPKSAWDTWYRDGALELNAKTSGQVRLDEKGQATIEVKSPFKDRNRKTRASVYWNLDVISAEGRSIPAEGTGGVQFVNHILGVKASYNSVENVIEWKATALDQKNKEVKNIPLVAELYRVKFKQVKERLGSRVNVYRTSPVYEQVFSKNVKSTFEESYKPEDAGRYVIRVFHGSDSEVSPVSCYFLVTGKGDAEVEVADSSSINVRNADKARSLTGNAKLTKDQEKYAVGDTAAFTLETPFTGKAWVTVETNKILDEFEVDLEGTASRIEIPVKPEYFPNAYVSVYLLKPGGKDQLPAERFGYSRLNIKRPDLTLDVKAEMLTKEVRPGSEVKAKLKVIAADKPVAGAEVTVFAVDESVLKMSGWRVPNLFPIFYPSRSFGVVTDTSLGNLVARIRKDSLFQKGFLLGDGEMALRSSVASTSARRRGGVDLLRKDFSALPFWKADVKTDAKGEALVSFKTSDSLTSFKLVAVAQTAKHQFGEGSVSYKVSQPLMLDPVFPRFVREGDEVEMRVAVKQKLASKKRVQVSIQVDGALELVDSDNVSLDVDKNEVGVVSFKARVLKNPEAELSSTTVTIRGFIEGDESLNDAVLLKLPVHKPTVLRHRAIAGTGTLELEKELADWQPSEGSANALVSTTKWLPLIAGLPDVLNYPHGCMEQVSSKILVYSLTGDLLNYLPEDEARLKDYKLRIGQGLKKFNDSKLPRGGLPYWKGGSSLNTFATIQATWGVLAAEEAGLAEEPALRVELVRVLDEMVRQRKGRKVSPFHRAFAAMVLARYDQSKALQFSVGKIYEHRENLGVEGRALLAIAMKDLEMDESRITRLLSELGTVKESDVFHPQRFNSPTRRVALKLLAHMHCEGLRGDGASVLLRKVLTKRMESSSALSTQENLWTLLALNELLDQSDRQAIVSGDMSSPNKQTSGWLIDLAKEFSVKTVETPVKGSWLVEGKFHKEEVEVRGSKDFRLERVVKNLTDKTRIGTEENPYKIGDEVLITFRLVTEKDHHYVALTDLLPAAFEVVNPDIQLIGRFYQLPAEANSYIPSLSNVERRDQETRLYFDFLSKGMNTYSVVARVTSAGSFSWPGAQVVPMYDARFHGMTPGLKVYAIAPKD